MEVAFCLGGLDDVAPFDVAPFAAAAFLVDAVDPDDVELADFLAAAFLVAAFLAAAFLVVVFFAVVFLAVDFFDGLDFFLAAAICRHTSWAYVNAGLYLVNGGFVVGGADGRGMLDSSSAMISACSRPSISNRFVREAAPPISRI